MAWIESHEELADHYKTQALCLELNCETPTAVGYLHLLWYFALKVSWKDGNLEKQPWKAIARACWWTDDPSKLILAFQKTGWLDEMTVHNWKKYANHIIYQRRYNEAKRQKAADLRLSSCITAVTQDQCTRNVSATIPNLTIPNLTNKDLKTTDIRQSEGGLTPVDLMRLWNTQADQRLPRVTILTKKRESHIVARLKSFPEKKFWEDLIVKVNTSHFLTHPENGWRCNFDWVMNPNNLAKILEGNYDRNNR